jgi:hypothetical protein
MKKLIYSLIVFAISALVACKKDKTGDDLTKDLIGGWELVSTQASIAPMVMHPSGEGNILTFSDNEYHLYEKQQLVKEGTYTVVIDTTHSDNVCLASPGGEFSRRIIFDNDESLPKTFFQITDHKLITRSGCFAVDGGVEKEYNRLHRID